MKTVTIPSQASELQTLLEERAKQEETIPLAGVKRQLGLNE